MSYQDNNPGLPPPYYPQQSSSLAVVSLVAGITSFVFLPLLGAITAIITGQMAKNEIRQSRGRLGGEGMATAGVILGWINLALVVIPLCCFVLFFLLLPMVGVVLSLPAFLDPGLLFN